MPVNLVVGGLILLLILFTWGDLLAEEKRFTACEESVAISEGDANVL